MIKHPWPAAVLAVVVLMFVSGQIRSGPGGPQPPATEPSQPTEPPNVAVLDFELIGKGADPALGAALASVIQSALVRGGAVRLIERSQLSAVLTEQDLQLTDLVDPSTAVRVGRLAGVDRLVLGSIASVEQTHTVTCRVIDVTTGEAGLAEEFVLESLDKYPQLGRLLAALIGGQSLGQDSVAGPVRWTETFDGPDCKLKLGMGPKARGGANLDQGRYVVVRTALGNQYSWIPGLKDRFYVEMDVAQLSGSPKDACGLIWGAQDTDAYLSLWVNGENGVRIEQRQGGKTTTGLIRKRDWVVLHQAPRSNRLRVESWDGRHRVFVNGVCVDDFYDPGFSSGRVGVRVIHRQATEPVRWAIDNLTVGAVDPSMAGIAVDAGGKHAPGAKNKRKAAADRRKEPWAKIQKVWLTREYHKKTPGLRIHAAMEIGQRKGASLRAVAQFFDAKSGDPLKDRDRKYNARGGRVITERSFSPQYRVSTYNDFTLFIPEEQLHLARGRTQIKCRVVLLVESEVGPRRIAKSDEVTITVGR